MGQNLQIILQNGQKQHIQKKKQPIPNPNQKVKISFFPLPEKAHFSYILPLQFQDYPIEQSSTDIDIQSGSEEQDEQNYFSLETFSNFKSIKQIKVKWNSFIKIKQKDYLEDYQIVKNVIGKGGFGVIRKVKSKYSNQIRVAKVVKKKIMKEDDITRLFIELYIMKMLDHPNIVKIYQVYEFGDEFILLIQMCTGGEVFSKTKKKKLPEQKAGRIIKQLLRCLIYMHNQKIVHRDIKPENMLFQNEERRVVKLIDFGIAKKMVGEQFLQERIGTPTYIAPQIIYKKYNQKCDIWAAGVSMYQLVCGKAPFTGQNDPDLMRSILRDQLEFKESVWSTVSDHCKNVITLMLNKRSEQRPSAKQLFQHQFFLDIDETDPSTNTQGKRQVIDNIHEFKFKNKLHAVVQTYVASQLLTKEQKSALIEIFKQFDSNSDGVISILQLKEALTQKNKMSVAKLESMMRVIDINGSGQIDYTQFLVANCDSSIQLTRQRLKKVFQYFDTDHNGQITYEQVAYFLQDYQSSEEQIRRTFMLVDINNDGAISEDQFIDLLIKKISIMTSSNLEALDENKHGSAQLSQIKKREKLAKHGVSKSQKARKLSFIGINDLVIQNEIKMKRRHEKSKFANQSIQGAKN